MKSPVGIVLKVNFFGVAGELFGGKRSASFFQAGTPGGVDVRHEIGFAMMDGGGPGTG